MSLADLAQPGSLSNPTAFAEYLTFVVRDADVTPERVADALAMLSNATKSIAQKDSNGQVSSTIGISARAWPLLFPDAATPELVRRQTAAIRELDANLCERFGAGKVRPTCADAGREENDVFGSV